MSAEQYTVKTNCKFCGRLFDSFKLSKVCPSCKTNLETDFNRIREYLEQSPDSSMADISETLNIQLPVINYFIQEGRLVQRKKIIAADDR